MLRRTALLLAGLIAISPAAAAEDFAPKVWLNLGMFSHHFRHGDYREDNYGLGVEIDVAPKHGFLAGSYINSDRERSRYVAYHWRPWHWKPAGVDLRAGLLLGMMDGYSNTHNGEWFPAALPSLSAEYGIFGANLIVIPFSKNGAVLALQLKLQVW